MAAIAPLLASPDEVEVALSIDEDFKAFLAIALKSSGPLPTRVQLESAQFRVVDAEQKMRADLRLHDSVSVGGQSVTIGDLILDCCTVDRTRLIHSLWRLETFEQIKLWLRSLRAVVRLAPDVSGVPHGHVLLAETIIPMIETVERRDYVLPNGDMASDAITRNLGIRAKVFALDRSRRTPRISSSNSIMDRLSRTLSKIAP